MNIVKMLQKQIEQGKNMITPDGDIVSENNLKRLATKDYLAGIKSGEVSSAISLDQYMKENTPDYASVQEVIDFICGEDTDEE